MLVPGHKRDLSPASLRELALDCVDLRDFAAPAECVLVLRALADRDDAKPVPPAADDAVLVIRLANTSWSAGNHNQYRTDADDGARAALLARLAALRADRDAAEARFLRTSVELGVQDARLAAQRADRDGARFINATLRSELDATTSTLRAHRALLREAVAELRLMPGTTPLCARIDALLGPTTEER